MSQEGTIIDYLGENKYVIVLPEEKEWDHNPEQVNVMVAHDYVAIKTSCSFQMEQKPNGEYPYKSLSGACNWRKSTAMLQIPIRDMIDVILPYLNSHKYLQQEHIKDRSYDKDDNYFEKCGLTEPRWRKGDLYPSYAYGGSIIRYFENGKPMIKFRRAYTAAWETVTESTFNLIKDSLQLCRQVNEIK